MTFLDFPWTLRTDTVNVMVAAEYTAPIRSTFYSQPEEIDLHVEDTHGAPVVLTDDERRELEAEVRDRVKQEAADVAIEAALLRQGDRD